MDKPYLAFYVRDWQGDTALQRCSFAARGLWIEMLCIMHDANPCGFLRLGKMDLDAEGLAAWIRGAKASEVSALLAELEEHEVFSRDDKGRIYCRKMVRAAKRSELYANNRKGRTTKKTSPENDDLQISSTISSTISQTNASPQTKPIQTNPNYTNLAPLGMNEMSEPMQVCGWFFDEGIKAGAIPAHLGAMPGKLGWSLPHRDVMASLLASYPIDEIKTRSRRLLARKTRTDEYRLRFEASPTTLAKCWDWFETDKVGKEPPVRTIPQRDARDIGGSDVVRAMEKTKKVVQA